VRGNFSSLEACFSLMALLMTGRIRVENLSNEHVQLLGRNWHIQETTEDGEDDDSRPPVVVDAPFTGAGEMIHGPTYVFYFLCSHCQPLCCATFWKVGHLPVLRPGQAFEYMSGTDLATPKGIMKGHFYMARVSENARSAKSGDDVEGVRLQDPLEVTVAPFPLTVG
jgi:uncharacterized protein affecting Mg2+/Co2+ transport